MSEERVRSLDFWRGAVTVTPLHGGITNRNYIVDDGEARYVARISKELLHLGIDRRNEIECQQFASSIGVAPAVAYHEPGIAVSPWVPGKTLAAHDVQDESRLVRVAATLRTLHDAASRLEGMMLFFCPFQTILTYARTARHIGARLPADIEDLLADSRALARRMSPYTPTLCHNDLLPANLLDEGEKIWLVDWEYAGVGNPLFDLAGVSANSALTDDQESGLLEAYRGRLEKCDLVEIKILKTASLLRESLWSVIQTVASDIDFDYQQYADDNLDAYRGSRRAI